jgi:gluconolactonase
MWNLDFTNPQIIEARILTSVPARFRKPIATEWAAANKPGHVVDCFLEGPSFDRAGNLYVTDIPHGRIFQISPTLVWTEVTNTQGWPNGIAIHQDSSLWISDYKRGLLRLDVSTGELSPILEHKNSESFKGINDLIFDRYGNCYFTDQGQTGMHNPTGCVYRLGANGRLDTLISNAPSPNGLALDINESFLFVAVTRANAVWRGPLVSDGSMAKVGVFRTFFGTSGPDGLAVDCKNRLVVAHASLGGAFVLNSRGEVTHFVRSPDGQTITNVSFIPGTNSLVLTDSEKGHILIAELPSEGRQLYSHSLVT